MKPCGCFGGQLGGLERRPAVLDKVSAAKRLIVGTGSLVKDDSTQELIKFDIMVEAFRHLGYELLNLTEQDIEIAGKLGLLDTLSSTFGVITCHEAAGTVLPATFEKKFILNSVVLNIAVAAFDVHSGRVEEIAELFSDEPGVQQVNILLLNDCDSAVVDSISELGVVDCMVCPADSDEAVTLSQPDARCVVASLGRYGKYIGRLRVEPGTEGERPKLSFEAVDVNESLAEAAPLSELYRTYQHFVREAGLLESYPRLSLPDGLEYVGSEACAECHDYEYEKWSTKAHAHAFATLERVNSHYDPECVICHVVGMDYTSGFITPEKTPQMKNVGCENCHGPGSKHIENPSEEKTSEPQSDCVQCHTPDHSGNFAGNEDVYLQKIVHWREPRAPGNVK